MLVQTPKREVEGDKAGNCFYHFDVVESAYQTYKHIWAAFIGYEQASLKKFTV